MISRATRPGRRRWPWDASPTTETSPTWTTSCPRSLPMRTHRQTDISWRENALLPMKPSDADTPGYQLGEEIKDDVLVPNGWTYHRVYDETTA